MGPTLSRRKSRRRSGRSGRDAALRPTARATARRSPVPAAPALRARPPPSARCSMDPSPALTCRRQRSPQPTAAGCARHRGCFRCSCAVTNASRPFERLPPPVELPLTHDIVLTEFSDPAADAWRRWRQPGRCCRGSARCDRRLGQPGVGLFTRPTPARVAETDTPVLFPPASPPCDASQQGPGDVRALHTPAPDVVEVPTATHGDRVVAHRRGWRAAVVRHAPARRAAEDLTAPSTRRASRRCAPSISRLNMER